MLCPFCQEVVTGVVPPEFEVPVMNRILGGTSHFLVLADISPLMPGHLLVVPRAHFLSFAGMPGSLIRELRDLLDRVRAVLTAMYESPIIMEHGTGPSRENGSCIAHAHLQVFPRRLDVRDALSPYCPRVFESFSSMRVLAESEPGYLLLEHHSGELLGTSKVERLQSQFIRRVVGERIGLSGREWDWRVTLQVENLKRTVFDLSESFQKE